MNLRNRIWPYLISVLAAVSAVIVVLDLSIPARAPLVLAFAAICPGMALVRLLRLQEPLLELLLAFIVSLSVAGVVATMAIYLGAWNAQFILLAIVEMTLFAVLGDLLRPDRAAP